MKRRLQPANLTRSSARHAARGRRASALAALVGSALLIAVGSPASARAAAAATIADPAGDIGLSFGQTTDVTAVNVSYADQALSIAVTYDAPRASSHLSLLVSAASRDELDPSDLACDPDDAESFTVDASDGQAVLDVPFVSGTLSAPASWSADTVTYTFASPTLKAAWAPGESDPFVCASGDAGGDDFFGAFPGRTVKLTTAVAAAGTRAELARRYGAARANRRPTKVRCLRRGLVPGSAPSSSGPGMVAQAWCAFEVSVSAHTYRAGEMAIGLIAGRPTEIEMSSRPFPVGMVSCGTTDFVNGPHGRRWLYPPFPAGFGGAYRSVWARRTSCSVARRVSFRWDGRSRTYRGWRCVITKTGEEFAASRCTRSGGRVIRFEGGA
jgi:hypothetical protein